MARIIWFIVGFLILIWLIGLILDVVGALIHIILVVVVIAVIWNLVTGRRTRA